MISSQERGKLQEGNCFNSQSLPSFSDVTSGIDLRPCPLPAPAGMQSSLPSPLAARARSQFTAKIVYTEPAYPSRLEPLPTFGGLPRPPQSCRDGYHIGQLLPAKDLWPRYTIFQEHGVVPNESYDSGRAPAGETTGAGNERPMENWSYQNCLNLIASASQSTFNFAQAYEGIAQIQLPPRIPQEEVSEMLANIAFVKRLLEQVRNLVQASAQNERRRKAAMMGPNGEDGNRAMPSEGKKKLKTRATAPGRCHSCNRTDTPEWRRGPDGPRTLCNACGLHYAKLEKKRRFIHPKAETCG